MPEEKTVLSDVNVGTGKERPWKEKRMKCETLARAYDEINPRKAERLRDCGTYLEFRVLADGSKRLTAANFCHVRLCPMCTWRRSLATYSAVKKIVDVLDGKYAYVFLTLTQNNVSGAELSVEIDHLMRGWQRLTQRDEWRVAVKGWFRGLEVTHNVNPRSKSYNTYHPHFHVLLAVNPSYFTSRDYINKNTWINLWRNALRLDYDPSIDVRRVKGSTGKAIAEIAKYPVKDGDIIKPENWELTVETVRILDVVLHKRRLVAYGGVLKDMHKKLQLPDEETGDLIHVGDDEPGGEFVRMEYYAWHTGYQQYYLRDAPSVPRKSREIGNP